MIKVGDTFRFKKKILQKEVAQFAKLTGDYNPLHTNESFAKKLPHKKRIVHGMLVASFASRLIGMELANPGALWVEQNFRFISPAFIGDRLSFLVEILQVSLATKSVRIRIVIQNTQNQIVVDGQGTVKLHYE